MGWGRLSKIWLALALALLPSCLVEEKCGGDQDCPSPKICNPLGLCVYQCSADSDCGEGFKCEGHRCTPKEVRQPIECPPEMVPVLNLFCIDRWEASRTDATELLPGVDGSLATSRPGVMPWQVGNDNATAAAACAAAGKRLCGELEWEAACRGPEQRTYGYGASYEKQSCNGIDTFGKGSPKLLPTGLLATCVNGWGAADMNGNLWEHVADSDGRGVRGGAYNCIDSMTLHRCDYIPRTWVPSALGFRCCLTPEGGGRVDEEVISPSDAVTGSDGDGGSGCLDPDLPDIVPEWDPECFENEECAFLLDPDDGCRLALCVGGICLLQVLADGKSCDDGNLCTLGDGCLNGKCQAGPQQLQCDDGNPCTDDSCAPGSGCLFAPNQAECDDDNPCTLGDHCVGGECVEQENACLCEEDVDCPDDGNLCNGTLSCDTALFPYLCKLVPGSIVTCPPAANPCQKNLCQPATGECLLTPQADGFPCDDANLCNGPDQCLAGQCQSGSQNLCGCPDEMVLINGQFCLDRYEASRPDATAANFGADGSKATSRPGVLPWFPVEYGTAKTACEGAGKRLCKVAEMTLACGGVAGSTYVYGNTYSATICNGIDAFCYCDSPNCTGLGECPYPHCYNQSPTGEWNKGCGAYFHYTVTGAFPACVNQWGAFDVNGNVWELVDVGTTDSWYKGGAYNCGDSEYLHQCGEIFQGVSARGFRCCLDPAGGK